MSVKGVMVLLGGWIVGLLALPGCGPTVGPCVPVQGKVLLGGQPLNGGTVTLVPLDGDSKVPRPQGKIDAQGVYALKTVGQEGAPPGKYRALVTCGEDRLQNSQFDPIYSHWDKSPLPITVTENAPAHAYLLELKPLAKH